MARATGLTNPDNAAKSQGAFKEGVVRIDSNAYKVHLAKGEDAVPATKWVWHVTRLAEGGAEPLLGDNDEPITEELHFSFGGKCLPFVHPGKADSPDDEEPEDVGTDDGVEGNTIFLNAADWKPNEKSSVMMLTRSLATQGVKAEYLNRCWAPDWNGCVFEMKTKLGEKGRDGKEIPYKVVAKIVVGPGGKSKTAQGSGKADKAADAEATLAGVLNKLSEELDGQSITRKAFTNRVRAALDTAKVDAKLLVPVLTLCKDDKWMQAHAETFDFTLSDTNITFGQVVPA